jgi:signal transduction histidine kinase
MDPATLLARLESHRTLTGVPKDQLAWLARVGEERIIEPGGVLTPSTGPVRGLYIVLEGHLSIRVDRGSGPRIVMEWHAGDVTGMLPYSRIKGPPGDVVAEERTTIVAVATEDLPRMIQECHELTAVLVHVMVDRARVFKTSELIDEKMSSLGRLAAGLAHELNNPASAVARSAKMLVAQLDAHDAATRQFCGLNLPDDQCLTINAFRRPSPEGLGPLELSDRQDAIDSWLAAHQIRGVDVEPLIAAGVVPGDLEALAGMLSADTLRIVLSYLSSAQGVRQLAGEIETAAGRIHSLVAAVKGFTFVNQQATLQPIEIGRGLADTVTVLRAKARAKSVDVTVDVAPGLPAVDGYGGELNQVWANLLDNAIDAAPGGHVRLDAGSENGKVIVRVIDDGAGIPDEIMHRIFDPFFTTKDVGEGTGLGLDISRRIVQRHRGTIDLHTGKGGTEFCVTLPASAGHPSPSAAHETR